MASKGGKGKGNHTARKNKYSSHSAGASRKGNNKKTTGGVITQKNKAAKAKKHQRKLAMLQGRVESRIAMTEEAKTKTGMKIIQLQKKFGTLNIRRLTDILSGDWEQASWYLERIERRAAKAQLVIHNQAKRHAKFSKKDKQQKKADRTARRSVSEGVSGSSDQGSRETQVDQK